MSNLDHKVLTQSFNGFQGSHWQLSLKQGKYSLSCCISLGDPVSHEVPERLIPDGLHKNMRYDEPWKPYCFSKNDAEGWFFLITDIKGQSNSSDYEMDFITYFACSQGEAIQTANKLYESRMNTIGSTGSERSTGTADQPGGAMTSATSLSYCSSGSKADLSNY